MSLYRHPDPRIEAWLADGPTSLSGQATMAIKSAARALPQRGGVALPWSGGGRSTRTILLAATVVLAAMAALALVVGAPLWFTPDPEASPTPFASSAAPASPPPGVLGDDCIPRPEQAPGGVPIGRAVLMASRVAVDYALPPETGITVVMTDTHLGFAANGTHGIVVVDVTEAKRHGSVVEQPRLGTDARTFMEELEKRFPYRDGYVIDFDVMDLTGTTLGGRPAWSAVVTWSAEHNWFTHIDRASTCALEFDVPHRLFVVDVGSSVVAVQIWAATASELTAWLPQAIGIADSLVLSERGR